MSDLATTFTLFPLLPAELREEIWQYCLPHRVCELDYPLPQIVFNFNRETSTRPNSGEPGIGSCGHPITVPQICKLQHTTKLNGRPPVLSRVSHEARSVALKAGKIVTFPGEDEASHARWIMYNRIHQGWRDCGRDTVHLNWHTWYEDETKPSTPFAADCLRSSAALCAGRSSFTVLALDTLYALRAPGPECSLRPLYPSEICFSLALRDRSWLVVMRTVIIHSDLAVASKTGLFGLLGDAYVQVIDAEDHGRLNALMEFARQCENENPVAARQDLAQKPADVMERDLFNAIMWKYGNAALAMTLRPAVMFRLCPLMCNYAGVVDAQDDYAYHDETLRAMREAGRERPYRGLPRVRVPVGRFRGRGTRGQGRGY